MDDCGHQEQLQNYGADVQVDEVGTILQMSDGIAQISGLSDGMAGEMVEFPGSCGLLNLEEGSVGAIMGIPGPERGDQVKRTKRVLEVPVGQSCSAA